MAKREYQTQVSVIIDNFPSATSAWRVTGTYATLQAAIDAAKAQNIRVPDESRRIVRHGCVLARAVLST